MATVNSCNFVPRNNDGLLVAAAQGGDHEAFELLVERHRRMILYSAMRLTNCREDAEDVVQQCLQKAFFHLKEFEGRSSFSTWLTRIAVNEALMLRRSGRRWRDISTDQPGEFESSPSRMEIRDSGPNPEDIYCQRERRRILLLAMKELKPGIRAALQVCHLHERSVRETARILGLSTSAAKSRVSRGRKVLREKVKRLRGAGQMSPWKEREKIQAAPRLRRVDRNGRVARFWAADGWFE